MIFVSDEGQCKSKCVLVGGLQIYLVLPKRWHIITERRQVNNISPMRKMECRVGCAKKRVRIWDAFWLVVEKMPSLFRKVGVGAGPFCRLGVLHGMAPKNVFGHNICISWLLCQKRWLVGANVPNTAGILLFSLR